MLSSNRNATEDDKGPKYTKHIHLILEEIFLNIPHRQVVRVCRLVCRRWREAADSESLWRQKCRRERFHLHDATKAPADWRIFYFLCKNRRNLLKNPSGEDKLKGWLLFDGSPKHWMVSRITQPHPNEKVQTNFVTSYGVCRKAQFIDLKKEGYSPSFMDEFQPDIKLTDWYTAPWDLGCEYMICVKLLNERKEVLAGFTPDPVNSGPLDEWIHVTHVFRGYGPGVRYICFIHGSRVRRFWAECCGIHLADSCIEIFPAGDL
uniref:FBA domain-containing protein n=1 Tax=Salarias fasciatus TaxID=181472 RepID=A0A672JF82_SALFA